jgi:malate dehydrogenase (oxaloacetate-decarboxylating)(NADP+)
MMVHMGDADALVSGVTQHFPDTIRPALQIVRMREGLHKVAGCYPLITRKGDCYSWRTPASISIPTAEDLVEIALCAAQEARRFDVVPRVAMLSFSSFGSTKHPSCEKVRKAVELLHKADPTLIVDGEIMADAAVSPRFWSRPIPSVR